MVSDYDDSIERRTQGSNTVGSGLSFHETTWERVNFVVIASGVLDREEQTDYAVEEINRSFDEMMRVRVKFFSENGVDLEMAVEEIN